MLLGTHEFAALLQLELFRVYVPAFLLMPREAVEYEILTQKRNKDGNPNF